MPNPRTDESTTVARAVAGFLESCRSPHTEGAYRTDLRHLAAWCANGEALDLLTIDAEDLARYRVSCESSGSAPATIARRLSAITSFAAYAAEHGLTPALTSDADVERPMLDPESTAAVLDDAEAIALLAAADEIGKRAGALIRLLMLDGLKVGEVIRADVGDLRGRSPRTTLAISGRSSAPIVLQRATAVALRNYVGNRRSGPLLLSERRGQPPQRLTRFGIDYLVKQVAERSGIERSVSGNTLRRRYVIAASARGTDLDAIRRNAGHSGQRTTRRYLTDDARVQAP